jgi:hypothetical protein
MHPPYCPLSTDRYPQQPFSPCQLLVVLAGHLDLPWRNNVLLVIIENCQTQLPFDPFDYMTNTSGEREIGSR